MNHQRIATILEQWIEYGFYGLIFFIPISIALVEFFAVLIILFFVIKIAYSRDFSVFKNNARVFWLLLAFFVFLGLSLVNSGPFFFKSLRVLFSKWGEYLLIFVVAVDHFQSRERIKRFFDVFVVSATLVGLSALSQKFFGFEFLRQRAMSGFAVTGPFENPNELSSFLAFCLPVMIALGCLNRHRKAVRFYIFLTCVILAGGLLLTFSRGGWLGFFVGVIVMIYLSKEKRLALLMLGLFSLPFFFDSFLARRFLQTFGPGGDSQRFIIWQGAWDMIKEYPLLGRGLGTFMDQMVHYTPDIGIFYAHNCYLQIWAEAGVFALISFLAFLAVLFYQGFQIVRDHAFNEMSILLIGVLGGLFGFLVHSFFDTQLYSLQPSVLFWMMLGLSVGLRQVIKREGNACHRL